MYEKLSDEQLVEKTFQNSENFRFLVERYQTKLMRYVKYLIRDQSKSADVVQDTFIKAFQNLRSYNPKFSFSSWIYRIAHNQSINQVKKHWRELPILPDKDFVSGQNLEEEFEVKENKKLVEDCLQNMPAQYAEPLSLFFLEEKSYREISDILRLPVSTVGTRINRAKIIMKKICQTEKN